LAISTCVAVRNVPIALPFGSARTLRGRCTALERQKGETVMKRRTFITLLGTSVVAVAGPAAAQSAAPRRGGGWGTNAEKEFRLGAGMGPRLMTEEEWKEHQAKMRTLKGAELETYRREMHDKMVARAKERGIEMPAGRGPAR
jgi:hypothetical protein